MIALLMLMAQGAWGWGGSGTSSDPWLIATAADWDALATGAQGDTYSGKYFRQTADATVTTESDLRTAVQTSQTVTLDENITLSSGRLVISGTTVTLNLNGHTLSRSLQAADADGQVIFVANGGKLTITDADGNNGKITGGWAFQGGGIYVNEGCELTISGGTITGNRADQIAEGGYGFGGGIENHGTMTMTGGVISGNTASLYGGGIYQNGTLNIQGNPVIDALYLTSYALITLTGTLTEGASIGVCTAIEQSNFTVNYSTYNSGVAPSTYFFVNNPNREGSIVLNGDEAAINLTGYKFIKRDWNFTAVVSKSVSRSDVTVISGTGDWLEIKDGYYVVTGTAEYNALNVTDTEAYLILCDDAQLTVRTVKVETGHTLQICGQTKGNGRLIANNDEYDYAAGIGGGNEAGCGTIIIHGGNITATGYNGAAGIGSGKDYFGEYAGSITIYGGTVNANGKGSRTGGGAGIGGGCQGNGPKFEMYGGDVTVNGNEGGGAGIGSGSGNSDNQNPNWGEIEIWGGTIHAQGGKYAAGIGGGEYSIKGYAGLHGGKIYAKGVSGGVAIGAGSSSYTNWHPITDPNENGSVDLAGSNIEAYVDNDDVPAIGGTKYAPCTRINIDAGPVKAYSKTSRAIGYEDMSYMGVWAKVSIYAGDNEATAIRVPMGDRYNSLANHFVWIVDCDHSGHTYTVSGTTADDTHTMHCSYCSWPFEAEKHNFDSDGKCTVCGVEQQTYTVTICLPTTGTTTDGDYDSSTSYQMLPNKTFNLPPAPTANTPATMEFAGWLVGTPSNNSFIAAAGEKLLKAESEYIITADITLTARYHYLDITLADAADNSETLVKNLGMTTNSVTLQGRTLYKDGNWNTLCLPFSLSSITGTPLEGATVKTLSSTDYDSTTGLLTLNFSSTNLATIDAGKPYIVKWEIGTNIENPKFSNVSIDRTSVTAVSTDYVDFAGSYSPYSIEGEDKSVLYLGTSNKLYYPNAAMTIGSCRAYFRLNGITAGDKADKARAFVLNFGNENTGIHEITDPAPNPSPAWEGSGCAWYTLDGRRLSGKPTAKGLYIYKGRKYVK